MNRDRPRQLVVALATVGLALAPFPAHSVQPRVAPEISAETWLNSKRLAAADLRGKVVLVEFWTFACWNCKNVEPYVKQWHERYSNDGLVVIAVHTPELRFERDVANVRSYVDKHAIKYAVAVDNDFSTWEAFGNRAWPAFYLIGKDGTIRHTRVGEGGYEQMEYKIKLLLEETAPPSDQGGER